MSRNYFTDNEAARRYDKFRPNLHSRVIDQISAYCFQNNSIEKALDVACGTGHSSYPLLRIANHVIGIDASQEMLDQTIPKGNISFFQASAEALPFSDKQFDLITVGLAFHWFNQKQFLREAARTLKRDGWLVIYTNWMTGEMKDASEFEQWVKAVYLKRYPSPSRGAPVANNDAHSSQRLFVQKEASFKETIGMNRKQLLNYLTTQSNITGVLLEQRESLSEIEGWLDEELAAFYGPEEVQEIVFGYKIWFCRLNAA